MEKYVRGGYAGDTVGQQGNSAHVQDGERTVDSVEGQTPATTPPRFCRKCFLREMELRGGLKESYQNMLERIEMGLIA